MAEYRKSLNRTVIVLLVALAGGGLFLGGRLIRDREEIGPALEKIAEGRAVVLAPVPARPQLEALDRGGDPEIVLFPQRRLEELARELGGRIPGSAAGLPQRGGGRQ